MVQQALVSPDAIPTLITGVTPIALPAIVDIPTVLARRTLHTVIPNNNATATHLNQGFDCNMQSTATAGALASTDLRTASQRINTVRTAANGLVGIQGIQPCFFRGNVANVGGFFLSWRLAFPTFDANAVFFVGVCNLARVGGNEASGVNNVCCFGADTADTDLSLIARDNAGGISKTNAGYLTKANLLTGSPSSNGPRVFDFIMQCLPNDTKITMSVFDASNNAFVLNPTDKSANLPLNTLSLRASALPSTVGAPTSTSVDFIHFFGYW